MEYALRLDNVPDDADVNFIAIALEMAAGQVRQMSNIRAAHTMEILQPGFTVTHGTFYHISQDEKVAIATERSRIRTKLEASGSLSERVDKILNEPIT